MEGPRPIHEHELNDLVQYLTSQLRPTNTWTIADEYPLAIHSDNINNVRVIKDQNSFVSAAVMKPLILKSPAGIFKAAAIGSVVTSPTHRNQGLSSQILGACLDSAKQHGCDFAILWTNLFDFYRKVGFELAGTEIAVTIPDGFKCPEVPNLRFMNSNRVDPQAILNLYMQHTAGSVRTVEDIRKFLSIPNARVYTAWNSENKLEAYAVEGKGADLDGYIHEWGGGVSKLMPLLKFAVQDQKRSLNLIAPSHSSNLIRHLQAAGCSHHEGVLGMIKILNPTNFLLKMKKFMRANGVEDIVIEYRDGKYYFGHKNEIFQTDSDSDLVKLVFGPLKASQLKAFDPATAAAFDKVFPISMWVWGWDSV